MNRIQKVSVPLTLLYETDASVITGTVKLNGILKGTTLVVPNLDSSNTITASILDAEGGVVWTKSSIADSATTSSYVDSNNYYLSQPLHGTLTLRIVTSATQTADRSFTFHIYYET